MTKNKMRKYADKYFLRANQILKAEGMNPWVNMQVFVRKGPGKIAGLNEAFDIVTANSNIGEVGGRIYSKKDGQGYESRETVMNIIVPVQEIMELETAYLGVIAAGTTLENGGKGIDSKNITEKVSKVVELAGYRPVHYFGARHWHYNMDAEISKAAFDGGAVACSTDAGAETVGKVGGGTIPHALENIFAYYYGAQNAVVKSTQAFDKVIDPIVPRIALIDYANKEVTDANATARALNGKLAAVRVDTCGENLAELAVDGTKKYWQGNGVTVTAVGNLRRAMNNHPYAKNAGIVLSSGFGNVEKVKAFNKGETFYGMKLYDAIGAGFLDNVRCSTADIVAVGETADDVDPYQGNVQQRNIVHKVGRPPRHNATLERLL